MRKDLNPIFDILKNNVRGLIINDIFKAYELLIPTKDRVSKNYIQRLITYGVKQKVLTATLTIRPLNRGRAPNIIKLKDIRTSVDEWATLIDLYRLFEITNKVKYKKPKKVVLKKDLELIIIKDYIIKQNFNLTKIFKAGVLNNIATKLGVAPYKVKLVLKNYRKEMKLQVRNKHARATKRRIKKIQFVDYCRENNMIRCNARSELTACNTIVENLLHNLPVGGAGMIIGTPTAFCANKSVDVNLFLTDNLKVAHVLDLTTDKDIPPVIVIGNGVDPVKAELKEQHWNNNNTTHLFKTIVDIVDRDTLCSHITVLAENHNLCKVVIMSSGTWAGDEKKTKEQGFDSNFKSPSEVLVKKYPNLHILAMTLGANKSTDPEKGKLGSYQWQIKYLHNGITENV